MSREDWEVFEELRDERRKKRAHRLVNADTRGWKELTPYHFRLKLDKDLSEKHTIRYIDWWPSSNKWGIYHRVNIKYHRGGISSHIQSLINEQVARNIGQ